MFPEKPLTLQDELHMCVQSLPSTVPNKNMLIQGLFVQDLLPKAIKEQQ